MYDDSSVKLRCLVSAVWRTVGLSACCLLLAAPAGALSIPYDIHVLGFTDAEHTRDDGYRYSSPWNRQNEAGEVAGFSSRYDGPDWHGASAWLASGGTTTRIGFWDAAHTRDDGHQYSNPRGHNEAGQVVGFSHRFIGPDDAGLTAWRYGGGSTTRIGLWDSEHTRDDGTQYSAPIYLSEAGQVVGIASRYDGANSAGHSAWQFDGAASTRLGFWDADHTRDDGIQATDVRAQNEAGQVVGISRRYDGATTVGNSAWQHSGGTTTRLGFTDAEHTGTDGLHNSRVGQQNQAGQVVGYTNRYDGSTYLGRSAWLHSGGVTARLGFTDADHTRDDGRQQSIASQVNEAGQVTGSSDRYAGAVQTGISAWQYSGGATTRIGLWDAEHTNTDGRQWTQSHWQNEAGKVIGESGRYDGVASAGQSAWQYNGGTTTRIGPTDAEHTRVDGYQWSGFFSMPMGGSGGGASVAQNEAGQVVGTSQRFSGADDAGWSVWQYDAGALTRMGVTDARHTRDDGYQYSETREQNQAGQVVGFSHRYIGTDEAGQTAWYFDTGAGISFAFDLSERSDGYAYSDFRFLGEDGLALGSYTLFDAADNDLGRRAFGYTPDDGFVDLGELVTGGLSSAGWALLARSWDANGAGQILGQGRLNDAAFSPMAFQLTPGAGGPVPIPTSLVLLLAGLPGMAAVRRQGRAHRSWPPSGN